MGKTVILTNTLHPSFFERCAQQEHSINPTPIAETNVKNYVKNAEHVGIYTLSPEVALYLKTQFPQAVELFRTEVTLDVHTNLIVIDFPIPKYTLYTTSQQLICKRRIQKKVWSPLNY